MRESAGLKLIMEDFMDTEKKPDERALGCACRRIRLAKQAERKRHDSEKHREGALAATPSASAWSRPGNDVVRGDASGRR